MDERTTDTRQIAEEAVGERPASATPEAAKERVVAAPDTLCRFGWTPGKPCHQDRRGGWRAGGWGVCRYHYRRGTKAVAGNCSAIVSGTRYRVAVGSIRTAAAHSNLGGVRPRVPGCVSDQSPAIRSALSLRSIPLVFVEFGWWLLGDLAAVLVSRLAVIATRLAEFYSLAPFRIRSTMSVTVRSLNGLRMRSSLATRGWDRELMMMGGIGELGCFYDPQIAGPSRTGIMKSSNTN